MSALIALSLLAAFQLLAVADTPAPPLISVDESNTEVRLDDRGVRIAIPIEWKEQMLEWARIETSIVDLKGARLTG